jgi:hypothetical protein
MKVLVGYRVPSGEPLYLEKLHHIMITGVTQWAGKTTALEALISRSGLRAITFLTKPEEQAFEGHKLPLFFKERSDWQYVESLISATLREDQRFNRSFIIKACRGTKTLREVWAKIKMEKDAAKPGSFVDGVWTNLDAYMEIVCPEIETYEFSDELKLTDGLNVMDLTTMSDEMQALVIRAVLEKLVEDRTKDIITVIPEGWKFIGKVYTPVQFIAEKIIRQGASSRVYLWNDSQDISGIQGTIRSQFGIWMLGVQRYEHEVERTLRAIPLEKKPKKSDVMNLKTGEFIVCTRTEVAKVYVQPSWLPDEVAQRIARGEIESDSAEVQMFREAKSGAAKVAVTLLGALGEGFRQAKEKEEDWTPVARAWRDVRERAEEALAK